MGLSDIGYSEPTPIQEQSIPQALNGKDILGAAQTGTGKTGAFVIPIIELILRKPSNGTRALILSPTRELAQQIDEQIFALGYHSGISSATIIGGEDFSRQANALRAGVDIIVATPGRLIDQMKVLDVDFSNIDFLVLDEADRMLDMGFLPDVNHIIDKLPKERHTMLFSATMPKELQKLMKSVMKEPVKIEIEVSTTSKQVDQRAYHAPPRKKLGAVQDLLDELDWTSCIVFSATKKGTNELERALKKKGINAGSIHGDRSQEERTASLRAFKNGTVPVIVATDVLARGIDIDNVSVIINYDVPRAVEDYIHRCGRTGRYDKEGIAITLVSKADEKYFDPIKKKVGDDLKILDLPEEKKSSTKESSNPNPKTQASKKPPTKSNNKISDGTKPINVEKDTVVISTDKDGKIKVELKNKVQKSEKPAKKASEPKKVEKKKVEVKLKSKKDSKKKADKKEKKKPELWSKQDRPDRIEKAKDRKQKVRKPSKGIWGLIKSFIPKLPK
ncbi:MAG: DEAD/DEAH box helicase [Balneola sp.]|nr:DEAD/DEAH box helicase [Balneola sp.]MBO6650751.1 DEAD/DEAH box helicase [Balneola sp.]MBO6710664.1 DEAD/DEAH box helicase [Balneola sp.]MBO6799350.1 DEAD/DEAH box helicase [Balneola sp.]MBO6869521.1 DEAD/DEAH box helicase [Balneola sp.]